MKTITDFIVKEANLKRDNHDLVNWTKTDKSKFIKLTDEQLSEISELTREHMKDNTCPTKLFDRFDKDTIINIAQYIIEADLYTAVKDAFAEFINKNPDIKDTLEHIFGKDFAKATKLAGKGLKVKSENNDDYPIYWDFSVFGFDEKFEIKTKCTSGRHQGGFNYTPTQRKNNDFIVIPCLYDVNEENKTYTINIDSINLKRK